MDAMTVSAGYLVNWRDEDAHHRTHRTAEAAGCLQIAEQSGASEGSWEAWRGI